MPKTHEELNSIPTFKQFCSDMNEVCKRYLPAFTCITPLLLYIQREEELCLYPMCSDYGDRAPRSSEDPCIPSFAFVGSKVRVVISLVL